MLMGDRWAPSDLSHAIASEINLIPRVSVSSLSWLQRKPYSVRSVGTAVWMAQIKFSLYESLVCCVGYPVL